MESPSRENPLPVAPAPTPEAAPVTNPTSPTATPIRRWSGRTWGMCKFCLLGFAAIVAMYLLSAYVILPAAWKNYISRHPALLTSDLPRITQTREGIPGDPLNVCLIGSTEEIHTILLKAGWLPADEITVKSSVKIAHASMFKKSYKTAPMSNLYLWQRKQDMSYQYPGKDVNVRHHVRFWKSEDVDEEGRPLWIGAATYDVSSGISLTTLQSTHHIEANIDKERDKLFKDLDETGYLAEWIFKENFHESLPGRNGGGDPYHTDGHLKIGLIRVPDDKCEE